MPSMMAELTKFDAAADSNFAESYGNWLRAEPKLKKKAQKHLAIIESKPSPKRSKKLAKMENQARMAIGASPNVAKLDWGSIDWKKFGEMIFKAIQLIIKLLTGI